MEMVSSQKYEAETQSFAQRDFETLYQINEQNS